MPVFFIMSRFHSYLSSAVLIVQSYDGAGPFVHYIKKHFAANKKFGSRDRKVVTALCYCYFRTAHVLKAESVARKIIKSLFLCETKSHPLLLELDPELDEKTSWPPAQKFHFLELDPMAVFPFGAELGESIEPSLFASSFLRQPLLYMRLRPGRNKAVFEKLNEAALAYDLIKEDCIVLQNATSLEKVLRLNKEAVVQDYNSQRVFDFPENISSLSSKEKKLTVWDCCAASGGKSILMYDRMQGNIQLTVSDIRKNILFNLQQRLQEAMVPVYKTFAADLLQGIPADREENFDIIICDVPCTGSGTWSRTPEQLAFFKLPSIDDYASRQQVIAGNAISLLKKGGLFFYITCSVFKKENEANVAFLQKKHGVELLQQQYLKGYEMQADTLFVAVLKK